MVQFVESMLQYLAGHPLIAFGVGVSIAFAILLLFPLGLLLLERSADFFGQLCVRTFQGSASVGGDDGFRERVFAYQDSYGDASRGDWSERFYERSSERTAEKPKVETKSDPFEVLGIKPDASRDEIKKAYKEALKLYHPDKNVSLPPKLRESSTQITKLINDAYQTLKDRGLAD